MCARPGPGSPAAARQTPGRTAARVLRETRKHAQQRQRKNSRIRPRLMSLILRLALGLTEETTVLPQNLRHLKSRSASVLRAADTINNTLTHLASPASPFKTVVACQHRQDRFHLHLGDAAERGQSRMDSRSLGNAPAPGARSRPFLTQSRADATRHVRGTVRLAR